MLQLVLEPPRDVSRRALLDELILRVEGWIRGELRTHDSGVPGAAKLGTMSTLDALLELCRDLPECSLAPGECLIEQGRRPETLYLLVEGAVQIERDGRPFARIDAPGAVFGEMSAVLDAPATATVRVLAPSRFRVGRDPLRLLAERPGVALAVLRATAARLDHMTRYLVDVKRQYADLAGHLGMVDEVLDILVHHQGPPVRAGSAREPELDVD